MKEARNSLDGREDTGEVKKGLWSGEERQLGVGGEWMA